MKKNVYLMVALLGMGAVTWVGCSDDEKIVEKEVEKIVVEQDLAKMTDAAREGLKGNPKLVTVYESNSATMDEQGAVDAQVFSAKTEVTYNEAGYLTGMKEFEGLTTKMEKEYSDMSFSEDTYFLQKDIVLKPVSTLSVVLGTDNRPTSMTQQFFTYCFVLFSGEEEYGTTIPTNIGSVNLGGNNDYWWEEEAPSKIEFSESMQTKKETTIDVAAKKATIITQMKERGSSTWEDSMKEVTDLDEYGYPNENSKEEFEPKREFLSYRTFITRAFQTDPSSTYIEKLDEKGNWILRYQKSSYGSVSSYMRRDIVYY